MSGVLVIAEHRQGAVREVTFEVIAAARELKESGAGPIAVAVLGKDAASLAQALAVEGVDQVLHVPLPEKEFSSAAYRGAVTALIESRDPAVVLLGFTVNGMSYGPAVAALIDAGMASDVIACSFEGGELCAVREFYAGKVHAELEFPGKECVVLMVRPSVWSAASGPGDASMSVFELPAETTAGSTSHREFIDPPREGIDITAADFILAVGRGIESVENLSTFEVLSKRLGATLACSRPIVDAGWLPVERQVGQSGQTVKPKLYLAMGISGAVQHVVGMKGSRTVIAVDSDPKAPLFNVAHYGAVADVMKVAEELGSLL